MKSPKPMGFWSRPAAELAVCYPAWDANTRAGYISIWREGKMVYLHRFIWEQLVGPILQGVTIDHINGVRTDNRLENLRAVPKSTNLRNSSKRADNKSGVAGVSFWKHGNAFRAVTICPDTRKQKIKTFSVAKYGEQKAFELACAAREAALKEMIDAGLYTERHGH